MAIEGPALGVRITEMLAARGVTHIFGIPGVHNQELYRGFPTSGINHVLARHEQGAGFMADGYARATGKPGVAYVITGPGLLNILTPLGQAYSDSVPVLVISSCLDDATARRGQLHQMLDQRGAGTTVCAASDVAQSAEAAYALIDRAFAAFSLERKRPRYIQVPIKVLEGPAPPAPEAPSAPSGHVVGPDVSEVTALLAQARKPLFIFGGGARFDDVHDVVAGILASTQAAVFTTYAGRGIARSDYPYFCGSFLGQGGSVSVLSDADLVIAVGTELSECDLWRDQLGHRAPLVRVDIDAEVLSDRHSADIRLQADGQAFLRALQTELTDTKSTSEWSIADLEDARARWKAAANATYHGVAPIADALRAALPDDTMIYSDMTQFAYAAKEIWDMPAPGLWHHPTGFGTLGYALPAAIGGKIGRGALPTLAIAGDYGLQYTINELATAVELGLSLPILVWDNGALGAIADSMTSAQIAPNAVIAKNPDFLALAWAYGANAVQPATISELCQVVLAALSADGPTVIRMTPALNAP